MSAEDFKAALKLLGWTNARAAKELGVCSRHRIWDWTSGLRPVPRNLVPLIKLRLDIELKRRGM